jgi:hypothetical protein
MSNTGALGGVNPMVVFPQFFNVSEDQFQASLLETLAPVEVFVFPQGFNCFFNYVIQIAS